MRICCIIKPTALPHTDAIIDHLEHGGFLILDQKPIVYTVPMVHSLYDHMAEPTRAAIADKLDGSPGHALVLLSPDVESVLEFAGRESDPRRCAPHTIRYRFGAHSEPETMGSDPWWENGFHRPISDDEARRDMSLIFPAHA